MHAFIRRALYGSLAAGGLIVLGAGVAAAADTSGSHGLLSGNQVIVPITVPVNVVGNAVSAASRDHRFAPVRPDELPGLHVSVDVLNEPEEIEGIEALDPRVYGLIVRTEDGRQALLLPDLEGVDTADQQLRITCRKGHIDPDRDRFRLFRFTVTRHS